MQNLKYFLLPFLLSLTLTPLVRFIALKKGLISFPRSDRWHKQPTAILGGVSIYLAITIPIFSFFTINKNIFGLLFGGSILFIAGLIDDRLHIAPYLKLFIQIIAACIAVFFGIYLGLPINAVFIIPLTIIWIIGVTNSFNLLDNIDGLAAGIAFIAAVMLFLSALIFSNNPLGLVALVLAGATLGFLPYNFNPAKIFMGDCGSMLLGYSLAIISITGTTRHISNLLITILMPVLILSIPIFDTVFVMIIRKLQGRKIFTGGRDHTSHQLVALGLSQRKTVLLLYLFSAIFGLIAIFFAKLNTFIISSLAFLAVVILLFFGFFLFETASYNGQKKNKNIKDSGPHKTFLTALFLYKRRMVEVALDFIIICIAYYSAYFLRFEGSLLKSNLFLFRESLPWVILIKMSAFFIFGLYRGVWRYISISDLLTIFKVVSIGSVASILFLTFAFRFQEYSRAVFFIDWVFLLLLISGSRIIFRLLGEFFSRVREKGNNILIFGAGDTGEMAIREIKRNKGLNYNAVGFIDDDLSKIGNKIQGIEVLGTRGKIKEIVEAYGVKELLIAVPSMDIMDFADIVRACQECGISYRKIRGILDKEERDEYSRN